MAESSLFERTPLVTRACLPMQAGQLRTSSLPHIPEDPIPVHCLEGAVRIASFSADTGLADRVTARLNNLLSGQKPDGSFELALTEALSLIRAAWQAYLWKKEKAYLTSVTSFLSWTAEHYEDVISDHEIRLHPADLIELAIEFYRVTGTQGSLRLLAKLRRDTTDWSVRLRTFDTTRPFQADDPAITEEIKDSLRGDSLADGLRGVRIMSEYSGNGTEAQTGAFSWPKISRWHGAVCGSTAGSPYLAGTSPAASLDPSVAGAWAEAVAECATFGEAWAADEAEKLYLNAMPAAMEGNHFAVNQLPKAHPEKKNPATDARILRGAAALLSSAVLKLPDGFRVLYAAPVTCGIVVEGQRVLVAVQEEKNAWVVRVQPEKPLEFKAEIRIPSWAKNSCVSVNSSRPETCKPGSVHTVRRQWNPGDVIRLEFEREIRIVQTHHQGKCVFLGPRLMALPATSEKWAYALETSWIENDEVHAKLLPVRGWKLKAGQPTDVPVLPETAGEPVECLLTPFAETQTRIAVFAGCRS